MRELLISILPKHTPRPLVPQSAHAKAWMINHKMDCHQKLFSWNNLETTNNPIITKRGPFFRVMGPFSKKGTWRYYFKSKIGYRKKINITKEEINKLKNIRDTF